MLPTLLAAAALAQSPVELIPEAQLRPRWEADTGRDGMPAVGTVSYFTWRARLGATLKRDIVSARLVVSDVRMFGVEYDTRKDFDAEGIDLRIGVLELAPGPWFVQVGRMEESLHRERLIAIANWRQAGRVFDGARFGYQDDVWSGEARILWVQEGDVLDLSETDQAVPRDGDAFLAVLTGGLDDGTTLVQPVAIFDRDGRAASRHDRITTGLVLHHALPWLSLDAEGYFQAGMFDGTRARGWMAGAAATLTPEVAWKPRITGYFDFLSGDAAPDSGKMKAFQTLYGANHRYYGNIDILSFKSGLFKDGQGLVDPALKLRVDPISELTFGADLHAMIAAVPLDNAFLAFEPDLSVAWRIAPGATLSGGANLWIAPDPNDREVMGWLQMDVKL